MINATKVGGFIDFRTGFIIEVSRDGYLFGLKYDKEYTVTTAYFDF